VDESLNRCANSWFESDAIATPQLHLAPRELVTRMTTFTATQVAQNTITFGKTGYESTPLSCTNSDFNNDGRVYPVCTFAYTAAQVFQLTDTVARVHFTYDKTRFLVSTSLTVTR